MLILCIALANFNPLPILYFIFYNLLYGLAFSFLAPLYCVQKEKKSFWNYFVILPEYLSVIKTPVLFSHKASPQLSCYRRIKVPGHYHPNKSLFPVGFFAFLGIRQTVAVFTVPGIRPAEGLGRKSLWTKPLLTSALLFSESTAEPSNTMPKKIQYL